MKIPTIPGMKLLSEREHAALLRAKAERDHLRALAGRTSRTAYLSVDREGIESVRDNPGGSVVVSVSGRLVVYDSDHDSGRTIDLSDVGVLVTIDAGQARRIANSILSALNRTPADSPESTHDYATRRAG